MAHVVSLSCPTFDLETAHYTVMTKDIWFSILSKSEIRTFSEVICTNKNPNVINPNSPINWKG